MRHKGKKSFEFITRLGNISLQGTYYHCKCSNSKSVNVLVSAGRKYSFAADELVLRYTASNSYKQASKYLRKDFKIHISDESLRSLISAVSGQIRQNRNSVDDDYMWDEIAGEKLYGYADGVLINIRKEGWKECKLLRYEDEHGKKISHRGLLGSLRISKSRTKSQPKAASLSKLIKFLARRIDRIDYPLLLELGYGVDSGPIESSCKNVVQMRMKGSGMRWSRKGASAMLEVRCALYSDIWEDIVKKCA